MKTLFISCLLALLTACGSAPQHASLDDHPKPTQVPANDKMNDLVMYAMSLTDTPYRYGGSSPDNGFDCSGFVGHVFHQSLGLILPRTSHEISQVGTALPGDQLRPGDLVFYNTRHSSFSHVGIFVGEGKFVHSPRSGSRIRIEKMNEKYWLNRYNGARRITG